MIKDGIFLCDDPNIFVVTSSAIEKFPLSQAWQPIFFYHCKFYGD